jgi:hypothetical protein
MRSRYQKGMSRKQARQFGVDLPPDAIADVERYCRSHPRSPSAVRRPRVMLRGHTYVALLGSTLEEGIAGIGGTVEAALRAFDVQYLNTLRPPRG